MSKIDVTEFFNTVKDKYATEQATEHSYRPALEKLLASINPDLTVINEPKQITAIGKPDFVIMRGDIPVGYVEAKDVGLDIRKMKGANKDQQTRYVEGLPNLIYTNGLDFDFYRWDASGEPARVANVTIGDYLMGLQPNKTQFSVLEDLLYDFAAADRQALTITSASRLAKIMARKGRLMRHSFAKALIADADDQSDLSAQYLGFREALLHDIGKADFADIYAETIVYGMFAARYHDSTPENFSRQEALELLPKSNPFLRKLFTFIASNDLPREIEWTIEELVSVYRATNVANIMSRWSDANDKRDPFLHFYETFLAEYNPKKRKSRGVWYTPEPVVNFIVRAVDDVLKTEFDEPMGLASTSKISARVKTGTKEVGRKGKKRREDVFETQEMHRVQILDPATGTGTFLAEVIRQIEPTIKAVDEGGWPDYVEHNLKPRLHGFELLMASYSMCHLKLDMMLTETGYIPPKDPKRLSVWLTNSLEKPQEDDNSMPLFGLVRAINEEAKGANDVKRDKPIMCIIGNPPYSVSSSNKGEWIKDLIQPYKDGLNEKKINLDDDYIKFLRFSESLIEQNESGIIAMITNNSFLDGVTHREMRAHLKRTFDKIYIIDLHGSTKKLETALDGSVDQNVFDIQQGVTISIFIKTNPEQNKEYAKVVHKHVFGTRKNKTEILLESKIEDRSFTCLDSVEPYHFFVPKDFSALEEYNEGFPLRDLIPIYNSGIKTDRDSLFIDLTKEAQANKIKILLSGTSDEKFKDKYRVKNSSSYKLLEKIIDKSFDQKYLRPILYRPFDIRTIYYDPSLVSRPARKVMDHIGNNPILLTCRQQSTFDFQHCLVTESLSELCSVSLQTKETTYAFPLYLYPDENDLDQTRRVNMDPKIRAAIEAAAEHPDHGRPDEVHIFDYIYGVLHCPAYRETYAEFLKIDFPRVPYPSSPARFWDISAKGRELRTLHLMDGVDPGTAYPFKGAGDGMVTAIGKKSFVPATDGLGDVYINDGQYFEGVPLAAWEFYIGGYQPAQKWLKDRKGADYNNGEGLTFDDRMHYRKIIHILVETDRIMKTIEMDL